MVFSFMRRPDADVSLHIEGDSFSPGDEVRVRVDASSNKGFKVRSGIVTMECVERFWKNEYDPATKGTRLNEKSQRLFEFPAEIFRGASVRSGIPVSEDVRFSLPAEAHRTVSGTTVGIWWQAKVSLDVPGARDVHAEQEFVVMPAATDMEFGAGGTPAGMEESFGECGLRIETESDKYRIGESVQGRLWLDPNEECNFSEVRVELVRSEKAEDKTSRDTVEAVVLETEASFRPGLSREWRFDLTLPDDLSPTTSFSKSTLVWKVRGVLARSRRRDYGVEAEIRVD